MTDAVVLAMHRKAAGAIGFGPRPSQRRWRAHGAGMKFKKIEEALGVKWLRDHLEYCVTPLLHEPWILDMDVTVKPLHGHQEGAEKGYNPHKPGRPSHTDHTYFVAGLRLILEVEVKPGNQSASKYSAPGLWELLGRLPRALWPTLIRGDCDWGTEVNRARAEQRGWRFCSSCA